MPRETIRILLVDGSGEDVALVREHVRGQRARLELVHLYDGRMARQYLSDLRDPAEAPDVVLVEVSAPSVGGAEFLAWFNGDRERRVTPSIALLRKGGPDAVARCYDLGANCVLCRPDTPDEVLSLALLVEEFWFQAVKLPRRGE